MKTHQIEPTRMVVSTASVRRNQLHTGEILNRIFRNLRIGTSQIPPVVCKDIHGAGIPHTTDKADREYSTLRIPVWTKHIPPVVYRAIHGAGIPHIIDKADREYPLLKILA
jgi:hypothetical protein